MAYVGYTGVANQANTSDGFANEVNAQNSPSLVSQWGLDVGDNGVVDLYHNAAVPAIFYILTESSGYVLQENSSKIVLEQS